MCAMTCSVVDLVEALSSCALRVSDVDSANSESADVVSSELVSPHQVVSPVTELHRSMRFTI